MKSKINDVVVNESNENRTSSTSQKKFSVLALAALGVVYGDIGTSPLYALRETINGHHPLLIDNLHIFGSLSLLFWTVTILVSFKYATLMMRADNNGEGGSIALLALTTKLLNNSKYREYAMILGLFATSLFLGDSIITPAISVLSAIEGIAIVAPAFNNLIIPLTIAIIFTLFWAQKFGTAKLGKTFGIIMIFWFLSLFLMGLTQIVKNPFILTAISPHYALNFAYTEPISAFFSLGTVFLAVTGSEALYADMGHFGRKPIRINWFFFVMPSLIVNYFGQGAMLLALPETIDNPFYRMAPSWGQIPLLLLATSATIIASQAVISGAFSVMSQATLLGYIPRSRITHTSATERGQIYMPMINWILCAFVIYLVIEFKSSSNLASMYGIAVVTTMLIDTFLLLVVIKLAWKWKTPQTVLFAIFILCAYAFYVSANATKIPDGGWFPLLIGFVCFYIMFNWKKGREILRKKHEDFTMPLSLFVESFEEGFAVRASGTAVFMNSTINAVPICLLQNIKHNHVVHEQVIVLEVRIAEVPYVRTNEQIIYKNLGKGFHTVILSYGFMQTTNVPMSLRHLKDYGITIDMMTISYFLSRETIVLRKQKNNKLKWSIFVWLHRNSSTASHFFHIPINRVIELGGQIDW